ncbi:NADH-quinone oxidoreductase subunit A [Mucilaginibacter antarcticus]|uniref:NADH-quinone oxidoreductase subunit A n=1 Tax=Mucilaginibacter antarcticus TaxID=1855725 RepID=A0ABW5XKS1_9SPHI
MGEVAQISEFGKILIFLIVGIIAVGALFFVNRLIAPHNPTAEKLTTYECGEEPTGNAWLPFNSRFYVIALVFLLFDVEMVFIFPWATVFGSHEIAAADARWGWFSLAEMFIFLGILILGLVYVWCKGDLDWIKPKVELPTSNTNIPASLYDHVNAEQSVFKVRPFDTETLLPQSVLAAAAAPPTDAVPIRKPMFKPAFKKPADE